MRTLDHRRRRLLGTAALALAAPFVGSHHAAARRRIAPPGGAAIDPAFAALQQIDAGALNVGYVDAGPRAGRAGPAAARLALRHPHLSWTSLRLLAAAGYRVIVPYLRGFGTTRFLAADTPSQRPAGGAGSRRDRAAGRAGHRPAPSSRGCDWGARTADRRRGTLAAPVQGPGGRQRLPDRATGEANEQPLPPQAELAWWYQYYFATERGRRGYEDNRRDFNKLDLAAGLAAVALRRRDVRPHRRGLRQPGSRRHRHPQLPLAAGPRRRRGALRRDRGAARQGAGRSPCRRSPSRATPTALRTRTAPPTPSGSPDRTPIAS